MTSQLLFQERLTNMKSLYDKPRQLNYAVQIHISNDPVHISILYACCTYYMCDQLLSNHFIRNLARETRKRAHRAYNKNQSLYLFICRN